ncbi:PEP-CTERM sorting domain-containing protein, partial [Methylophilus sp.]
ANAFVGYLNSVSYAGTNQWRLPAIIDTGAVGCSFSNNGNDCGYNVDTSTGEMARLYYDELGGQAINDKLGNYQPDVAGIPDTAFFDNEVYDIYWSSLPSAFPSGAWIFATDDGVQMDGYSKSAHSYVWAVTSALAVPVPEADSVAMLMAGLGLLGLMARRKQSV